MERLLSDGLWKEIRGKAKKAKRKRAAIAYCTSNHLFLSDGDVLVVDASNKVIKSRATSAVLLAQLHKAGVLIYSLQGLHAKVALLDDVAVVGSANSSTHSEGRLIEAAVISDSPLLVAKVQQLITSWAKPSRLLSVADIDRLNALPKDPIAWQPGTASTRSAQDAGREQAVWITPVNELPDDAHPEEERAAIKGEQIARQSRYSQGHDTGWIRIAGKTNKFGKEARPGDLVVQIWKPLGSKRLIVCPPETILTVRKERSCTRVHIEHTPTRLKELPFGKFEAASKKADLRRPIRKTSNRRLAPDDANKLLEAWKRMK